MFEVIVTPSVWMLRCKLVMPAWGRGGHGRSPDQTDAALVTYVGTNCGAAFFMPTGPITYGLKFLLELFAKCRKEGRAVVGQNQGEQNFISYLSEGFGPGSAAAEY